ncbi:unnamed protein product [Ectocarpus sp. 8 AP-2014]
MTFIIHSSLRYTHGMRSATPPCLSNHGVKRVPCYLRRHASKTCDSPKRESKQRDLQQQATLHYRAQEAYLHDTRVTKILRFICYTRGSTVSTTPTIPPLRGQGNSSTGARCMCMRIVFYTSFFPPQLAPSVGTSTSKLAQAPPPLGGQWSNYYGMHDYEHTHTHYGLYV